MINILAFLFVLGVLIFVHELGHFLVARWHGVRVLRFSLGFDPKLVKFTRGGTEYSIGIIPLGGFVKLAGESVEEERTGAPDEFLSMSKWVRFQVYLAGPIMNVLLALVVLTLTLSRGADVPLFESAPAVLGKVAAGSPAEKAGLKAGDEIIRVGDHEIKTWDELDMAVMPQANQKLEIVALRNGSPTTTDVTPDSEGKFEVGTLGILPVIRPQLLIVDPSGSAAKAGLKPRDVLAAVDGTPMDSSQVTTAIQKSAGRPLAFTIVRDGQTTDVSVVPQKKGDVGMIGVSINWCETRRIEPNLWQAAKMSAQQNWETTVLIGGTLKGLVLGHTPMKQLMGPVAIAQLSGTAAQMGWKYLLETMAMISLNLGLINLLPVPVMDGGQIAILGFEGLTRRDLSFKVKERILMAGAALVVMLMVTVIYNDVMRLLR